MIRFLLPLLLLTSFTNINAQDLTLRDLVKLQSKDPSEVEKILIAKKWTLLDTNPSSDTTLSIIEFDFKNPDCVFAFLYDQEGENHSRVYYVMTSKTIYESLLKQVKADKYKFVKTNIGEGEITKVYSEFGLVWEFSTTIDKTTAKPKKYFKVALFARYDYTNKDKTFKN